jgi:hypothetical protein
MDFAGQSFARVYEDLVTLFFEGLTKLIHVTFFQRITFLRRVFWRGA